MALPHCCQVPRRLLHHFVKKIPLVGEKIPLPIFGYELGKMSFLVKFFTSNHVLFRKRYRYQFPPQTHIFSATFEQNSGIFRSLATVHCPHICIWFGCCMQPEVVRNLAATGISFTSRKYHILFESKTSSKYSYCTLVHKVEHEICSKDSTGK